MAGVFIAALTAGTALVSCKSAQKSADAAEESTKFAEDEQKASRAPELADVPLGPPYDRPLQLTAFNGDGTREATVEVESPGQIVIQLANGTPPLQGHRLCSPWPGRFEAVAIPVQNVGRGPAVIVEARVGRITGKPENRIPLVGDQAPIDTAVVAPGQTRILAAASPGPLEVGDAIACEAVDSQGGFVPAEVTYRGLQQSGKQRTLTLGLTKGPAPGSQWQVGSM